ncbi:hypothetical protein V2G26_004973 [Clonostachys chloroleuca]|uniref:2OG-Fe dioxygenase-domain-containing protein n=1 Tax=Clonostachys chloroleuca TaxID=1926264 RepID=A0AA35MDR0_9HYPO|nr:unnamed protein product [Clonostachys chloroleuca]
MSFVSTSRRALRASSSLLRATKATGGINTKNARLIHQSTKASAVYAATQPVMTPPPPPMMPEVAASAAAGVSNVPVPKGQLNIREHMYKPSFYQAIAKTMAWRKKYHEDRYIFVPGEEMKEILLGLGGTMEDYELLKHVGDSLTWDPTLPYRKTINGRLKFDYTKNTVQRLEFQPFALSVGEDFDRYDSGVLRRFDELDNNIQHNTVAQGILIFKSIIVHGMNVAHREKMDYDQPFNIMTFFTVRTTTNNEILGEPALEGIHADGVDHTLTTLLATENMRPDSAATFMHDMQETTGIKLNEAKPENIRGRVQHTKFLDTLMVVDHEYKHSLSPVYQDDTSKDATRDMIILFTRKPTVPGHVSGKIDSTRPHKDKPMEIPLFVPNAMM